MPLRVRLILLVGLVLLVCLGGGSVLVVLRADGQVQTELRAALHVGAKTVHNGFDDMAGVSDRSADLRRLVATFNGNRHVQAMLLGDHDQVLAASRLAVPADPVPVWFRTLIDRNPAALRLPIPWPDTDAAAIVLQPNPVNEIGEVWGDTRDIVLILGGFALLSILVVSMVVGRALRPLETLASAFARIGHGDYHGGVPVAGPRELARLARGFNVMADHLAAAAAQNQRLNERLLCLQAEERADLARDLHDEIGPMLFAVDMTAATIERLAEGPHAREVTDHARAIHEAVGRMQRHVRTTLERLRPLRGIGLEAAVARLVTFWRGRRSDTAFSVEIGLDEEHLDDDVKETIYRVVQEAVSNAVRHGAPTRVSVAIVPDGDDGVRITVGDDGTGGAADGPTTTQLRQFGLVGMRERVMAMAGSLNVQRGADGHGMVLTAVLPAARLAQPQDQDAME